MKGVSSEVFSDAVFDGGESAAAFSGEGLLRIRFEG
jgi:hypothetical protein